MGGLARKATVINESKADSMPILILDAGDLFFPKNRLVEGIDNIESAKVRCDIIIDSYNAMGCNAFSPGSRDFALGISHLNLLKKKSDFDYISCNLYKKSNLALLFDEYKIKNINGSNVAFIGAASSFNQDSLLVKEPIAEIRKTVNKLSGEVDFTILLFNGSDSDLDRLQESDINIDLILRSKGSAKATEHGGRERIPLYSSGNKGKYLNKITILKTDSKKDFVDIALENTNIKLSNKRINNKKKGNPNADLEEIYKDNQKVLNDIANHRNKIKQSNERIEKAINKIESKKIPLNAKVASKPEILMIVDKGMAKIPEGPPIKDIKGRRPGDPHHGHNH